MNKHDIRVEGAWAHHLKNISVDIPREQPVLISGVSACGRRAQWM